MMETKAPTVARLGLRDSACPVMRDRIHQIVVAAHGGEFAGGQVIERQVNGAAPAVARLRRHIALFEHLGSVRCSDSAAASSGHPPAVATSAESSPRRAAGGTRPRAAGRSRARPPSFALSPGPRTSALVPTIRFARYPSTGLPVKLSQVAYFASQRTPGTNSSTKTKSSSSSVSVQRQRHHPVDHLGQRQARRPPSSADSGCRRSGPAAC